MKSRIHLKTPKRTHGGRIERDSETKQQSLELFKNGLSIEQIAALRQLSPITIEGHLAFYVQQGKVQIQELMDVAKVQAIQKAIEKIGGKALMPLKGTLGEAYSFGEIKLVMAHVEFLNKINYAHLQ